MQEHTTSIGSNPAVEYLRGSDYGGGIGGILYTLRGGTPGYNHYNSRGDVVAKTSPAGSLTWQAQYEAFGTRTAEDGTNPDRQKANTKDEDPHGLLNEGFRYRDLETGTFITRDPLGFVDGPNVYTYVVQNPWTKFDPLGLSSYEQDMKRFYGGAAFLGYLGSVSSSGSRIYRAPGSNLTYTMHANGKVTYRSAFGKEGTLSDKKARSLINEAKAFENKQINARHNQNNTDARNSRPSSETEKPSDSARTGRAQTSESVSQTSQNEGVHGNSKSSSRPQHRYEMVEKATEDVVKTGISGVPLNKNGTSKRANSQINALNKHWGENKYIARIMQTNIPGRQNALNEEQLATNKLKREGHSLLFQIRPVPKEEK